MSAWVETLTTFIGAHPHWAGVLVFLVAASEAVVLIGYVVPGTAILLTVGGIVGLGHLPLLPILLWAAAGAVAGDGLSYWLGHTYKDGLRRQWPFSRYPELIDRGEAFFNRHGGKSVFLGRFVPVLKPIIPTVAGILGMPPAQFYVANIISAIFWAPAHILPGVLVGASLGVLHGVSARLVFVALGAIVVAAVTFWTARFAVSGLAPIADRAHRSAYEWATRRPTTLAHHLAAPFDPDHPATPALIVTLLLLVTAALAFAGVVASVISGDSLLVADSAISHFVSGLRTPWTDSVMIALTAMGDAAVIAPLILTVVLWLLAMRAWSLAIAVASALGAAGLAVAGLKALVQIPRPGAAYSGVDGFAFPSGHTTMTMVLFGLAAWLIAGNLGQRGRALIYAVTLGWVLIVGVSRIYLGAHWSSDVSGGLLLGTAICATVAVLYRHASRDRLHPGWFAMTFVGVFVAAGALHVSATYDAQVARYAPQVERRRMDTQRWWGGGWRELAQRRVDLAGEDEEPLDVQWLGTPTALEIRLLTSHWQRAPEWAITTAAGFLKPATPVDVLPVMSALHDGRKPLLTLVRGADSADQRWVFRAWSSGFDSSGPDDRRVPLLVASVVRQQAIHPWRMLTVLVPTAVDRLPAQLLHGLQATRVIGEDGRPRWLASPHPSPMSRALACPLNPREIILPRKYSEYSSRSNNPSRKIRRERILARNTRAKPSGHGWSESIQRPARSSRESVTDPG